SPLFLALTLVFTWVYLGWVWATGELCAVVAPEGLRPSLAPLRAALLYTVSYLTIYVLALESLVEASPRAFLLVFPLHVATTACSIYIVYFAARGLVRAERQVAGSFRDIAGQMVLLWVFPIGVWFL